MNSKLVVISLLVLLTACSAKTSFDTVDTDVVLEMNKFPSLDLNAAESQTYKTTSFGQYAFKVSKEGLEPMYGLMPLKFNGGYLAADILFFAPALFFNLREVFPYYEIDMEKNEIRYKKNQADSWSVYTAPDEHIQRAKAYFNHKI